MGASILVDTGWLVTGGRHDDEAVGERHVGVVDLDGDAAAGAGDPARRIEVPAQLCHQLQRLPHRRPGEVSLRNRRHLAAARHCRLVAGSVVSSRF